MYSLGIDLGSSSVKLALVDTSLSTKTFVVRYPEEEMKIVSPQNGWAEQDPNLWWKYVVKGIQKLLHHSAVNANEIVSIGISYQMHGLVLVDKKGDVLRNSIIWCDSRAVSNGVVLTSMLHQNIIEHHLLNQLGNFTASKLHWVREHEPASFNKIHKIMLPGDYIAYRMSGEYTSTFTGMSEGIFYDFKTNTLSPELLAALSLDASHFPRLGGSFEILSSTNLDFEKSTGIKHNTPISYRAGDQPNNAFSLGVLNEGEAAGTGGTSGVIYAVSSKVNYDAQSRINTFAHVNHITNKPSLGTLLCINGTGILYNWIKSNLFPEFNYTDCEAIADQVQSDGLSFLPFGNGAERILQNKVVTSMIHGIDFNRHDKRHVLRAGLEGVAYAFVYGLEILRSLEIEISSMRVGNDNLFQSKIFSQTLADAGNVTIKIYETTGAIGAAKGSANGAGVWNDMKNINDSLSQINQYVPEKNEQSIHKFNHWKETLHKNL